MPAMKKDAPTVCVVGLGYIGLPTASMFATHGFQVHGVDNNPEIIKTLKSGRIHIEEPGLATVVKAAISSGNLVVSETPKPSDVFIIAVPTPYQKGTHQTPLADMSFVKAGLESVLPLLKKGNLVILESTSPAGTTKELVLPMISKAGFVPGDDIGVAYCPERVIPGQALKELIGNDRIVGAINDHWGHVTKQLYKSFVSGEVYITDPTVAEMAKLVENTYRDVNIALANELARVCERLGVSVWDVIQLANRHPRVQVHKPGPGVGGHCISVDPWFLVEKFPEEARLIKTARTINDAVPHHVAGLIASLLPGKERKKIAILGLAYKGNVDDARESPAIEVIKILKNKYAHYILSVHDPFVKTSEFENVSLNEALKDADMALFLTAHDVFRQYDPAQFLKLMKGRVILDTHNMLKAERWLPIGFDVYTLGTGKTGAFNRVSAS